MIVFHVDSGLGNQMLAYCEYLALKKCNPNEEIILETLAYDIKDCDNVISQWNGYELNRIFGIQVKNIRDILTEEQYSYVKNEVIKSEFWNKNWNYSPYVVAALNHVGISLNNKCTQHPEVMISGKINRIKQLKTYKLLSYQLKRLYQKYNHDKYCRSFDDKKHIFGSFSEDYLEQRFSFIYAVNNIDYIADEIKKAFVFPEFTNPANINLAKELTETNSIAIHARRGDMLSRSLVYYEGGYFKRAIHYIKEHVDNPVFYFFCDPGSETWCMSNLNIFGLNRNNDNIKFVTWNKGENSFRDMQLMSLCKHNVITNSSFGWWAAYLNNNPQKITCTPDYAYHSTHHF